MTFYAQHLATVELNNTFYHLPTEQAADFAYVRFHGTERLYGGGYSPEELAKWARVITQLGEGRRAVYAYFNNDIGGNAVRNALELGRLLSGVAL